MKESENVELEKLVLKVSIVALVATVPIHLALGALDYNLLGGHTP